MKTTKLWRTLAPHIKLERYLREGGGARNARFRLELKRTTPEQVVEQAVHYQIKCAACGEKIHPVRKRNGGSPYIAVTCPLAVNVACSRSPLASVEYKRIAEILRGEK